MRRCRPTPSGCVRQLRRNRAGTDAVRASPRSSGRRAATARASRCRAHATTGERVAPLPGACLNVAPSLTPSIRSSAMASRPSAMQSAASGGNVETRRASAGNHGEASAGQRAISTLRVSCRNEHTADTRAPLLRSISKRSRPALHSRAPRSANVGGAVPSSSQALRRRWHNARDCAAATVPSGQQMSASPTLRGGGRGAASPRARGRLSTTSNSSGNAVTAPYCPGSGVPSGRPTHTPIV